MSIPSATFLEVFLVSLTTLCASGQNLELSLNAILLDHLGTNIIQLECEDTDGMVFPDAQFSLNGTNAEEDLLRVSRGAQLLITRKLEGTYTCEYEGRTSSNERKLIAMPDDNEVLVPRTFYAEVGTTAVLDCAITPGALVSQYFTTWRNGTSGLFYDQILPMATPSTMSFDPRYSIDPMSFMLMISDVQLSDSDSAYQCYVGVHDPQANDAILYYENTGNFDLSLKVYMPPKIIEPPIAITRSLADPPVAIFTCIAVGFPAPEISWRHNGRATTLQRYNVSQTTPVTDPESGGLMSTGTLRISSVTVEDSGSVECVASDDTTGIVVPEDSETTALVVLDGFRRVQVSITQGGDAIYRLGLRASINTPVHLHFRYRELTKKGELTGYEIPVVTDAMYNNTDVITHTEFRTQIPYPRFRVGVALVFGLIRGPINETNLNYDISSPSLVSTDFHKTNIIIAAVVPLVLLVFTVGVIVLIWYMKTRENNLMKKMGEIAKEIKEVKGPKVKKGQELQVKSTQCIAIGPAPARGNNIGHDGCEFTTSTTEIDIKVISATVKIVKSGLTNPVLSDQMYSDIKNLLEEHKQGGGSAV